MSTLDEGRRKSGQSPTVGDVGPKTDGSGRRQLVVCTAGEQGIESVAHRRRAAAPPRPFLLEAARAMKVANGGSRRAAPSPLLGQTDRGQTVMRAASVAW